MPYDQNQDSLRAGFITVLGAGFQIYGLHELWDKYLTSLGITGGTLADRQKRAATAAGMAFTRYVNNPFGSTSLGPEIAPNILGGDWTTVLPGATNDGTGLHFVDCDAGTQAHAIDTEDEVTYRIQWTISGLTEGSFRWQLYGDTAAHLGQSTTVSANGFYSENVSTSAAGSLNNLIRANVTGPAAGNTMNITTLSVRKVL